MAKKPHKLGMEPSFHEPQCNTCKHYNRDATCKAFPGGIPHSILEGDKHNIPLKEQSNDIVYSPVK